MPHHAFATILKAVNINLNVFKEGDNEKKTLNGFDAPS